MMRIGQKSLRFITIVLALFGLTAASVVSAQLPVDVPREDIFVFDQIFRYGATGNFNIWAPGSITPHRHALAHDTLWAVDEETAALTNMLASEPPIYNDDFTQMTANLRDNVYWTDGELFMADDVVFTVETLKANPTMGWGADFNLFVESVEQDGDFTVVFNLTEANPRFHLLFQPGWNGMYVMPKHIWETVEDPVTYTFNPMVTTAAYTITDFDPNGFWELYERRDDWERSPAGIVANNPGPKYALSILYGTSDRKAIAMARHELDVFFNADFEAFEAVIDSTPAARSWYTDFPWAYPNEVNFRVLNFNLSNPNFQSADVRWALALALDVVDIQTNYIGGVTRVTALPMPASAFLMGVYHNPMEEWLQNFQLEIEEGEFYQPYDATVPNQIAEWAAAQGHMIGEDARAQFGSGWWAFAPDVAERLLIKSGFSRDGAGNWMTPDGERWSIDIIAPPDEPDSFRIATAAQDMWGDFGINVTLQGLDRNFYNNLNEQGDFDVSSTWRSYVNADGDPWQDIRDHHTDFFVPVGESTAGVTSNIERLQSEELDQIIEALSALNPTDPAVVELGMEFNQLFLENMWGIPVVSFKKFVTWDETYWTGFPTNENPATQPLYWFMGGKYTFQNLRPVE